MAAMADSPESGLIGSTQVTEINITHGVQFIGMLPKEFELATDYCLGVCSSSQNPELAFEFARQLVGSDAAPLRQKIGFELS